MTDAVLLQPTDLLSYTQACEALRLVAYDDATGLPVPEGGVIKGTLTNGWGHTGEDVWIGQVCTQAQATAWLRRDLAIAAQGAVQDIGLTTWRRLDPVRQSCLVDMCLNLGQSRLLGFEKMIAAIRCFDWSAASAECLDSVWHGQVGARCERAAEMLRTGQWPVFS